MGVRRNYTTEAVVDRNEETRTTLMKEMVSHFGKLDMLCCYMMETQSNIFFRFGKIKKFVSLGGQIILAATVYRFTTNTRR